MTYTTNEMVLPRNFAMHSEDEMMYLDGGGEFTISFKTLKSICGNTAVASEIIAAACARCGKLDAAFWFAIGGVVLGTINANLDKTGGILITYGNERYERGRRKGYRLVVRVSTYK